MRPESDAHAEGVPDPEPSPPPAEATLDALRPRIDAADQRILAALGERHRLIRDVIQGKLERGEPVRDIAREEALLQRLRKQAPALGLDPWFVEQLFREILTGSVRYQGRALQDRENDEDGRERIRVAFQGTDGAYSHQAALRHFHARVAHVECVGYTRFAEAAQAVIDGQVDVAILPIENTTAGSINDTYDLLNEKPLHILGEEVLPVHHCLLALAGVEVENVRRILSHPQAIAQCSRFLGSLPRCQVVSYFDTAMAARKVADDGDLSQAAIAGAWAGERYGLQIIARGITNQAENYTRFVVVAAESRRCSRDIPAKTSMIFATIDEGGALLQCLNILGDQGINMTKLESRPRPGHPWQSLFYLDIEGHREDPRIEDALERFGRKTQYLKILGTYPKWFAT
jgi:chorismate mutase / prephenate dehydratase